MISVYMVDARELFRRGLRDAIDETPSMEVIGEAANTFDAIREVGRLDPDVIVVDFDLGAPDALGFCESVNSGPTPTPVLVTLPAHDRTLIGQAMLAGASGHLVVSDPADEIVARIRAAHHAPPALGAELVGDLFDRVRAGQSGRRNPLADLTVREREIMTLLADGLDNRRIGDSLHLSPKTVKNYVSAILRKLGMTSRTEAAVFAAREAVRSETGT